VQAADVALESQTANTAGLLAHELKRSGEGALLLDQAIALAMRAADPRAEAAARSNLGLVHHNRGDIPAALDQYRAALAIYQRLGLRRSSARLQNNLGGIHYQRGEAADAERLLRAAAAEFAATGAPSSEANALGSVALVERNRGDLKAALATMQGVLDQYRALGDPEGEGYALSHLGLIHLYMGEYARAEELLARALPLRRKHEPRGAYATARQLARARHLGGAATGVLELLAESEAEARKAEDRSALAGTRAVRAEVLAGRDAAAALVEFRAAAEAYAALGEARNEALAVLGAGGLELAAGRPAVAEADARRALERIAGRGFVPIEAQARQLLARAAASRGDSAAARAANDQALTAIEALRANIGTPELRAAWTATVRDTYELAVELGMARHAASGEAQELERAFALAERMRARAFRELFLTPAPRAGRRTSALRARFEAAQAELNARATALLDGRAAAETAELTLELDRVAAELHAADPVYAGLRAPRATPLSELRRQLGPDTVLVQYLVGERGGWVWLVSQDRLVAAALPPRAELDRLVRRVTDAWSRRTQGVAVHDDAARLADLVLPPALGLPAGARLAIVADGPLEYLPFAALPSTRDRPLVAAHEIVMLPSASALVAQRAALATRAAAPRLLTVFADPVFQPAGSPTGSGDAVRDGFAPLPGTRIEAETLLDLGGRDEVTVVTGAAASRARVLDGALAGHRIVHLATHGVVDARLPVQSGLMLARYDAAGRPQAGFLDLNDVAGLELDAELVVLSACDTALGREIRGEGLQGLTRGFMQAGARSVAATLWRVPDRATAEFVRRFYAHLLRAGAQPAAALRATQLEMLAERRWRDPHHWAAFTLQGDWLLPTTLVGTLQRPERRGTT
jgi:CHAT domain-containing protein